MSKATQSIDPQTQRAAQLFLARLPKRYNLNHALLYGSRARGTHNGTSDADLAVILKGEHGNRSVAVKDMAALAFHVMLETGVMVEALPLWDDEVAKPELFPNPTLIKNILRDRIRL